MKKKRVNFLTTDILKSRIHECMEQEGYHIKQRSWWIQEAIKDFLSFEKWYEHVSTTMEYIEGHQTPCTVYLTEDIHAQLMAAKLTLKREKPELTSEIKPIIQASIINRLMKQKI